VRFWDASALLSLLVAQRATEELTRLVEADPAVVTWWATPVEATSAVAQLQRDGALDERGASDIIRQLRDLLAAAYGVEPVEEVRAAACRLLRVHDLRGADALQLAAALVWADHQPSGLAFVCLDEHLRRAADREGFDVLPADLPQG